MHLPTGGPSAVCRDSRCFSGQGPEPPGHHPTLCVALGSILGAVMSTGLTDQKRLLRGQRVTRHVSGKLARRSTVFQEKPPRLRPHSPSVRAIWPPHSLSLLVKKQ